MLDDAINLIQKKIVNKITNPYRIVWDYKEFNWLREYVFDFKKMLWMKENIKYNESWRAKIYLGKLILLEIHLRLSRWSILKNSIFKL